MPIDRTTVLRGPGIVAYNGAVFYTKGDIKVTPNIQRMDIVTSMFGKVDEHLDDRSVDIEFESAGEVETAAISALLTPYANMAYQASMLGASDVPVAIKPLSGKVRTYAAGAVTKLPSLHLSTKKTLFGPCTITCVNKKNTAWNDAAAIVALTTAAFSDTTFTTSNILTEGVAAAWGAVSPWDAFETKDGFTVDFDLGYDRDECDNYGLYDLLFNKLNISIKCQPIGPTDEQIDAALPLQGTGIDRGISLQGLANNNDLVLTMRRTTSHIFTFKKCFMSKGDIAYGNPALRISEVEFTPTRPIVAGAQTALFSIA